jgi:hypothetical protein
MLTSAIGDGRNPLAQDSVIDNSFDDAQDE